VNSGDELVDKVIMNSIVTGPGFAGNVAVLTLVLAIIFVVLLVVLIVLLTRKPEKVEEFEESYY
jgi:preprotein translocase subunit SecG